MSKVDQIMESIRRHRGELELKMHLAKQDAKDEWAEMETKFHELEARSKHAGAETEQALEDIGKEISRGYERIRKSLS